MSEKNYMIIAGSVSGIVEVIISHPLDRIKTEMQIITLNNSKTTAFLTKLQLQI